MDFGHRKKHDFSFVQGNGPTHCPRCMRTKDEAIHEQVQLGEACDDKECFFAKEIKKAIEDAKNSKYCINCGYKFDVGDVYCIKCGTKRINV